MDILARVHMRIDPWYAEEATAITAMRAQSSAKKRKYLFEKRTAAPKKSSPVKELYAAADFLAEKIVENLQVQFKILNMRLIIAVHSFFPLLTFPIFL